MWGTPHFPPGRGYGYAYSDTGYVLLGRDHRAPRRPCRCTRRTGPASSTRSGLDGHVPRRASSRIAAARCPPPRGRLSTLRRIHGSADWAGGGLVSDVDDLAAFAPGAGGGSAWSRGPWLDEMLRLAVPHARPGAALARLPRLRVRGGGPRDATGFLLRGHRGHWGALMHVDPVTGLTITGTINQSNRRPDARGARRRRSHPRAAASPTVGVDERRRASRRRTGWSTA